MQAANCSCGMQLNHDHKTFMSGYNGCFTTQNGGLCRDLVEKAYPTNGKLS